MTAPAVVRKRFTTREFERWLAQVIEDYPAPGVVLSTADILG